MRIAHLTPVFPPYESGVSTICFYEAKELAKVGHKITVFTPDFHQRSKISRKDLPFRVKYLKPLFEYGNAAFVPQIVGWLKNFDIIHLHYPFCGASEALFFAQRFIKRRPLFLTYHNDLKANGLKGEIFFKIYNQIFLKRIIKEVDRILISSFNFVPDSQLKDYFSLFRQKFIELPLAVDTQIFSPRSKRKDLIEKYEIKDDEIVILFVGALDKSHFYKGLEILLESLARLKQSFSNFKLLVVGDGDLKPYYINLVDNLRLGLKVIFAGSVSHHELSAYYNLADLFVFPSRQPETFGLVVLEAMACGKPIIASDWPALRNLVKPTVNGFLFQPSNVQDLMVRILNFFEKPELIKEFGQASRQMVRDEFSWPVHIKKLVSIYEEFFNLSK